MNDQISRPRSVAGLAFAALLAGSFALPAAARADAIFTVKDLGTDAVLRNPGSSITAIDTVLNSLPDELKTPRTRIIDGSSFAGVSDIKGGPQTALYVPPTGLSASMGTLGGSTSTGVGVNSAGQVVGYSSLADGTRHAFLYAAGKMLDLNTLVPADTGYTLTQPLAIADNGTISTLAFRNGIQHAVLLTPVALGGPAPVPEPASWMVVAALAGAGSWALRRNRRPAAAGA